MAYEAGLIGEHASIVEVRRLIDRVARSAARAVLIYGETGTGKGLIARLVHQQSARAPQPFVDVNCAAIPDQLLESELFGHEKGAFTGAAMRKSGLIETANGGSIFLDEIRDMNLVMQAKLLTVLDTQRMRRVGATAAVDVDVRFIAATNRVLLSEVKAGRFREDLYYRLQVVAINSPPLRERGDDIFVLTDNFLRRLSSRYGRVVRGLSPEARDIFRRYRWPGNVRELENLLERIFILEDDAIILARHLPDRILRDVREMDSPLNSGAPPQGGAPVMMQVPDEPLDYHEVTAAFQAQVIRQALVATEGNLTETAARLGLTRHALRHQMLKLGMA
ncbi:sigma-54 interaction domain-containing protein [Chelatococcus asaccharovorans]|uniref:sigma-54 interaction domain-containing protein n=1 Tax=Chelatococcus asaccharovorans TaxID=28210 RepID=UPI00224C66F1|nr:sigma-54 dependent transcriptional regulator [Chelatococcus asaccharovorans]CAH1672710.1 Regulatory Fis family protein [Chelatococcus asaccharovorans]CAH1675882.1 Regulatory Fis family protein [Chelatococcus asaccharovorans]